MTEALPVKSKYAAIDLCCGMGGLSFAAREEGIEPIIGVDIFTYALATYKKNFPNSYIIQNDIADKKTLNCIKEKLSNFCDFKDFIIVSGPPCQGFSVAGKRNSSDPRNEIMISVAEAISFLKPHAAIVENVPMVVNEKHKFIVERFKEKLVNAGYYINGLKLDALEFGTSQRRKRIIYFVLDHSFCKGDILEIISCYKKNPKKIYDVIGNLPVPSVRPDTLNSGDDNGNIPNHYAMRHSESVKGKIAKIPIGKGPLSYRKLDPNGYSVTLISGHRAPPVHYAEPRSITVREAARLQGFPDSYIVMGPFGRQMEQVTNAVPLPLGRAAIKTFLELNEKTNGNGK